MRTRITWDEYDVLTKRFEEMSIHPTDFSEHPDVAYFPSEEEIKMLSIPGDLEFIAWLLEMQNDSSIILKEKDKKNKGILQNMLNNNLHIYFDASEIPYKANAYEEDDLFGDEEEDTEEDTDD